MKRYQILYQGRLAESHITRVKASSRAFELAKSKGWDIAQIQILDTLQTKLGG